MRLDAATSPWPAVAERLAGGVAVLPFGALEAHGLHLPLATDTLLATAVAERLADALDAVLLPALGYGHTWSTARYPGTLTLSASTVTAIVTDVAGSLAAAGAKALVVVNGDWGNREPLTSAAALLTDPHVLPTLVLDTPGLDEAASVLCQSPPAWPGLRHAEEAETSIVMALRPQQVRMSDAVVCYPHFPPDFGTRPVQLHPYSPTATFGDPRLASAAKGRALLEAVTHRCREAVEAFLTS